MKTCGNCEHWDNIENVCYAPVPQYAERAADELWSNITYTKDTESDQCKCFSLRFMRIEEELTVAGFASYPGNVWIWLREKDKAVVHIEYAGLRLFVGGLQAYSSSLYDCAKEILERNEIDRRYSQNPETNLVQRVCSNIIFNIDCFEKNRIRRVEK